MASAHHFSVNIEWTGNTGSGTSSYDAYDRAYMISADDKQPIFGSSAPVFLGDNAAYNPEEMLVAALSSCHMLWYLHLCADAGVVVTQYTDSPTGELAINQDGGGLFKGVMLQPRVTITDESMVPLAQQLHAEARAKCFIANSCNFPVVHQPVILAPSSTLDQESKSLFEAIGRMVPKIAFW
jgi:organic hydroperoxide reductase OsmC/OhrA